MTITVSEFRTRFPEFSSEDDYPESRIQMFIEDTLNIHLGSNERPWNGKYNFAQSYLVAHLLTLATATELGDSSAKVGPISNKTVAGVSVSRAVVAKDRSDSDDLLSSTAYGIQFLSIRNTCFVPVLVGNCLR